MLPSHATTRATFALVWCGGCWPGRFSVSGERSAVRSRGVSWLICSSTGVLKRLAGMIPVNEFTSSKSQLFWLLFSRLKRRSRLRLSRASRKRRSTLSPILSSQLSPRLRWSCLLSVAAISFPATNIFLIMFYLLCIWISPFLKISFVYHLLIFQRLTKALLTNSLQWGSETVAQPVQANFAADDWAATDTGDWASSAATAVPSTNEWGGATAEAWEWSLGTWDW